MFSKTNRTKTKISKIAVGKRNYLTFVKQIFLAGSLTLVDSGSELLVVSVAK